MTKDTPIIARVPVTFFTIVMGLSGFTMALRAGEAALGLTNLLSWAAYAVTVLVFVAVGLAYASKATTHFDAVRLEWCDPVKLALFPALSISMVLLAAATLPLSEALARFIWLLGVPIQGVLTIAVITGWIGARSFQHGHLSPAWFVPVVGNGLVPIAGAPLGFIEVSWFFMSVALIFWFVLLALVMNRLIFHDPLPERLQPTLVILIAPPAVAFLGWVQLMDGVDAVARILLNAAYLFTLIVAVQLPRLLRLQFSMSFWALSFPFAAVTSASFHYAGATGSAAHRLIAMVLLAVLCIVIARLLWRTVGALHSGAAFEAD